MDNLGPDYWGVACGVLLECGRARVHTLRNALNAVALGVELLGDESASGLSRQKGLKQQIAEAASEIEGLQTLLLEAAQPHIHTLPEAATWALNMTRPVAIRRSVEFVVPYPVYDLPSLAVGEGFSVALGELLITACLASDRGNTCTVTGMSAEAVALSVEWLNGRDAVAQRVDRAHQMMSQVIAPDCQVDLAGDGARQRVTIHFPAVA